MAFNPSPKQLTAIKAAVFVLALLPFLRMAYLVAIGQPVDPVAFLTHGSGDWALYLLCATLCATPLRRFTGMNWVIRLRRMLGLYAFFYACVHFLTFVWFEHDFDVAAIWKDVLKHPYVTVGFAAFVLLIPLAATSTQGMIRRLGRNWTRLHRLIYLIAPLAIVHLWWIRSAKHNFQQPITWGLVVAVLLGLRVYWSWRRAHAQAGAQAAAPARTREVQR
jgi:sulfoxide reductase heme-binding subunit YedZ